MEGRSIHSRGPAAEKLLSPSLLCVRGTSSFRMSLELDRSGRRPTSDRRRQSSARYAGAAPTKRQMLQLRGICKLSHENRLSRLGLANLTYRRVKTDLVLRYKISHNVVNVDCVNFCQRPTLSYIRGNVMKLNKPRIISARHSHFCTSGTINLRNSLPDSILLLLL